MNLFLATTVSYTKVYVVAPSLSDAAEHLDLKHVNVKSIERLTAEPKTSVLIVPLEDPKGTPAISRGD